MITARSSAATRSKSTSFWFCPKFLLPSSFKILRLASVRRVGATRTGNLCASSQKCTIMSAKKEKSTKSKSSSGPTLENALFIAWLMGDADRISMMKKGLQKIHDSKSRSIGEISTTPLLSSSSCSRLSPSSRSSHKRICPKCDTSAPEYRNGQIF